MKAKKRRTVLRLVREFTRFLEIDGHPVRIPKHEARRLLKGAEWGYPDRMADEVIGAYLGYGPGLDKVGIVRSGGAVVCRWHLTAKGNLSALAAENWEELQPAAAVEVLKCGLDLTIYPCSPELAARAVWRPLQFDHEGEDARQEGAAK